MAQFRRRPIRNGPLPFRYVFLLSFVFFSFSTAAGLWMINKGIEPVLMDYAETQTKKIAMLVINHALTDKKNIANINDIIETVPKADGGVQSVRINTEKITRMLAETTALVEENLNRAEKGELKALEGLSDVELASGKDDAEGIVYYVPLGQATKNSLFGNLGPRIPVQFHAIGNVRTDIKPVVTTVGINNQWIEVSMIIEVNVQIIVPFATKVTTVTQTIPVGMGLIQGEVPQFYNGGNGSGPAIELPTKKK